MAQDNTAISLPPYSINWDGGQWVVKKTISKTKSEGEREELVGYYINLDHAIYYGLIADGVTGLGKATCEQAVAAQQSLWEQVKEHVRDIPRVQQEEPSV